jgi:peroxiredoxin
MSERKEEVKKVKFWSPLRIACTVIALGLLAAFGVSSCNSRDVITPANSSGTAAAPAGGKPVLAVVPPSILNAENPAAKGKPIKLSDYSGKVLLINLWATWCGPCRMETPELVKLHKEFQERGVEMIGLSTEDPDASAESVNDFVKEYQVPYHIGWATRDVALGLMQGRTNIPQSFIISRDGHVVRRFIGFSPDRTPAQIKQALEEALQKG